MLSVKGMTPQAITSSRGATVTIKACGSIKWNHELLTWASPGSGDTMTESGWSNSLVFIDNTSSMKHVTTMDLSVMILFDDHQSHIYLTLSAWGEANNVVFLPFHHTRLM
ncbi:hypothetical protein MAR_021196 [Mya arenaria]|uniref:Uncharacterized protein n=1 Tax=Mya arenaria TaxID=6604 RepID=A0ABY7E740_MYAAR|nr:hypothetical protein MAR_021196 [Mya arenaria]